MGRSGEMSDTPARELRSDVVRTSLVAGAFASLASTLAIAGNRHETGSGVAPTNATSHWPWGRQALAAKRPAWRHTVLGYVIHAALGA